MTVEKDRWLQVRMEGHERDVTDALAERYGVSTSQFVRLALAHIEEARPTLTIYPIATPDDEEKYAGLKERAWLQLRISQDERERLETVAADYGLDASKFVRVVLGYLKEVQPKLQLMSQGKAFALAVA